MVGEDGESINPDRHRDVGPDIVRRVDLCADRSEDAGSRAVSGSAGEYNHISRWVREGGFGGVPDNWEPVGTNRECHEEHTFGVEDSC